MITVEKYPPKIALAENQVVFGFQTGDQVFEEGKKAVAGLLVLSLPVQTWGQFSLTFAGRTIVFTCVANPEDDGNQIRNATPADTVATWTWKLAEDLKSNYYISTLYDVNYVTGLVTLTAKKRGKAYTIIPTQISLPDLAFGSVAGEDDVVNPFFKVYMQVVSGGKVLGEDYLPVDKDGKAYFDIGEYLRPEFTYDVAFPEYTSNLMYVRNGNRVEYYVRYGLYFGDVPQVKKLRNTAMMYALPGGVNNMTEGRYNDLGTSFYEQMQKNMQFLTWHPMVKRTQPGYMEKLWYIIDFNVEEIWLKARLHIYNTATGAETLSAVNTMYILKANRFDMVEINCGYQRMQLDVIAAAMALSDDEIVKGYDVFLSDQWDAMISEVRTFIFDDNITLFDRTFMFKNSFGVFETFTAREIKKTEPQYERLQYNLIKPIGFGSRHFSTKPVKITESMKQMVEFGNFLTVEEKLYLSELMLSREVYEVQNGMLYPVAVTGTNKTEMVDDEFLNNVLLEYAYAFTDEHFSKESSVMPIGSGGGGMQKIMATKAVGST